MPYLLNLLHSVDSSSFSLKSCQSLSTSQSTMRSRITPPSFGAGHRLFSLWGPCEAASPLGVCFFSLDLRSAKRLAEEPCLTRLALPSLEVDLDSWPSAEASNRRLRLFFGPPPPWVLVDVALLASSFNGLGLGVARYDVPFWRDIVLRPESISFGLSSPAPALLSPPLRREHAPPFCRGINAPKEPFIDAPSAHFIFFARPGVGG